MSAGTLGGHVNDWGSDERELVRRCREGSEAAYAELVRQHRPRLYSLAFRLVGDREAAEDVVQETFLAAFKAIDRFQPKPSLAPWLNTITVRIAQRAAARGRARPKASLDRLVAGGDSLLALSQPVELDPASDPHAVAEAGELRRAVSTAIEGLPFAQRAAVVLRFVMGLDYAAAAQTMGVPLNTYKSHLLRGTKVLRTELARHLEPGTAPTVVSAGVSAVVSTAISAAEPSGNGYGSGVGVERRRTPVGAPRLADGSGGPGGSGGPSGPTALEGAPATRRPSSGLES
jgi:RNA polymerase sigma-70 factor (ECF subfamily)